MVETIEKGKKNWPPCYPLIYHDIQAEILEHSAIRIAEQSYRLWLLYIFSLVLNLVAIIATAIESQGLSFVNIVIAVIYLAIWPWLDFWARHLSLYNGFKFYFLNTALEILFNIFIGLGYFHGGGGGLIVMIYNFKLKCIVAGVFCAICIFLVLILTIFHVRLFRQVYKHFKEQGDWTLFPRK